jgi:hypothetical protein
MFYHPWGLTYQLSDEDAIIIKTDDLRRKKFLEAEFEQEEVEGGWEEDEMG